MDVALQRNLDTGMTENLAECFNVDISLDAARGEAVAQRMEFDIAQTALFQKGFVAVLKRTRFERSISVDAEQKHIVFLPGAETLQLFIENLGNRNFSQGIVALWHIGDDARFSAVGIFRVANSLHGSADVDDFFLQINISEIGRAHV